nr:site-specific DNA-methyltransferase [Anaerolineae bacterium]
MPQDTTVEIKPAKGRPMLTWVGKRPLRHVTAFPAQHVESYAPSAASPLPPSARAAGDGASPLPRSGRGAWGEGPWPAAYPQGGLLFHGDNKEVLAHLLANGYRGKVKLVYIDPPFDSGADYVRTVNLRGAKGTARVAGEGYTLGEQIQYTDIWANDNYLQFMYERLLLLRELLTEDGSFYLHCDWKRSYLLRCLLDEVFGPANCRNEIVWQRNYARSDSHTYNHIHDTLYFYTKGEAFDWNKQYTGYGPEYIDRFYRFVEDGTGRRYASDNLTAAGLRNGSSGRPWRGFDPSRDGNHWKYTTEKLDDLDAEGRIHWPESGGMPRYKRYLDEMEGRPLQSIWTDISFLSSWSGEREDYPTQKPEALLERIIRASTNPGDLVLDC